MTNAWRIWLLLPLAVALQNSPWLARWQPLGTHIDVALLVVVVAGLLLGWETGAWFGLAAGLLTGYCAAADVGAFALSRGVTGGVCGLFDARQVRDNALAPPLAAAGAVLGCNLIMAVMSPANFTFVLWIERTLAAIVVHALLMIPLHALVARFVLPPSRAMFQGRLF